MILVFHSIFFLILLPKTYDIITTKTFSLTDFDIVLTIFIMVNLCILLFVGLTLSYLLKVIKKIGFSELWRIFLFG